MHIHGKDGWISGERCRHGVVESHNGPSAKTTLSIASSCWDMLERWARTIVRSRRRHVTGWRWRFYNRMSAAGGALFFSEIWSAGLGFGEIKEDADRPFLYFCEWVWRLLLHSDNYAYQCVFYGSWSRGTAFFLGMLNFCNESNSNAIYVYLPQFGAAHTCTVGKYLLLHGCFSCSAHRVLLFF
jgi:hypothetical protein